MSLTLFKVDKLIIQCQLEVPFESKSDIDLLTKIYKAISESITDLEKQRPYFGEQGRQDSIKMLNTIRNDIIEKLATLRDDGIAEHLKKHSVRPHRVTRPGLP